MRRPKAPPAPEKRYTCSWGCPNKYAYGYAPQYRGTRCGRCGHEAKEVLEAQAARQLDGAAEDLARYAAECGGAV